MRVIEFWVLSGREGPSISLKRCLRDCTVRAMSPSPPSSPPLGDPSSRLSWALPFRVLWYVDEAYIERREYEGAQGVHAPYDHTAEPRMDRLRYRKRKFRERGNQKQGHRPAWTTALIILLSVGHVELKMLPRGSHVTRPGESKHVGSVTSDCRALVFVRRVANLL
jgi:hypothetical protein